jgi:hypothetical protein
MAQRKPLREDPCEWLILGLIPILIDQNWWAQSRMPMDMMRHGWLTSLGTKNPAGRPAAADLARGSTRRHQAAGAKANLRTMSAAPMRIRTSQN